LFLLPFCQPILPSLNTIPEELLLLSYLSNTDGTPRDEIALLRNARDQLFLSGSASIPEASIPYRYRIVLVSIARIDIISIQYRFFTAFNLYPFKIFFSNLLVRRFHQNLFLKYLFFLNQNLSLHDLLPQNLLKFLKVIKRNGKYQFRRITVVRYRTKIKNIFTVFTVLLSYILMIMKNRII
jgi:hypothetical protein